MKRMKWLISSAMCLSSILPGASMPLYAQETEEGIFPVLEDAYIRKDRTTTTGNYEDITSAHGSQYVGKGLKVLNAKEYGSTRIIPMMKFQIPTAQQLEENDWNQVDLVFHVFKNANPENCPQTYHFYWTDETDWSETTVTWSTKPDSVDKEGENWLFDLSFDQDDPWEFKAEEDKIVREDITQTIVNLSQQGVEEITIFAAADSSKNTSLMFHSKESSMASSYLEASHQDYSKEKLLALVELANQLDASEYTASSWKVLCEALEQANRVLSASDLEEGTLKEAILALSQALAQLSKAQDPADPENIAYAKPTRSNLSKDKTDLVNDGNLSSAWSGQFYPSYVDIDLMDTYDLEDIEIYLPAGKNIKYTLYGSADGENYNRIGEKSDDALSGAEPFVHSMENVEARIIRVYLEYTQNEDVAWLSEVKVHGTKSDTQTAVDRSRNIFELLNIEKWEDTAYAAPISKEETIGNVYGIIERILGAEYTDWFAFELEDGQEETENDWFEISEQDGKTLIRGNEGLSLTRGLNEYFKTYLHVNVSEQTTQIPENLSRVIVESPVYKETDMSVRYAFNYCTISYTFAFYGEEDWQRENDWLALSGANVVLDLAGQEAVWIEFLMNFGYSFDDAKDWLTGPAYYAWQFMDNMETFGGPIPDGYVRDRLEMARKNQRWKNSLGMQTVIQGYAGMVPTNFNLFQPDADLIAQGSWNGFSRPSMIATDGALYDEYSSLFYQAQEDMLGNRNHYYAVDPFHEGGIRPAGLTDSTISREVLESMIEHDDQAVWVVQGWQSNPTNDLLKGMEGYRDEHVLIVDLIKYPIKDWTKYDRTSYGSTKLDAIEFNKTPWAWCLLSNFGGNPSMHGEMETMVNSIMSARQNMEKMSGIGIISEAANDNPVLYDLIFDLAWADESFSLDQWLEDYIVRRYGMKDYNLISAWRLMKNSLYDYGVRFTPEVYGAKNKTPQSYSKQSIGYDPEILEKALELMLKDYDKLSDLETYRYDLSEMLRQQTSNYSVTVYNQLLDAVNAKDIEAFQENKEKFLNSLEVLAAVESTQKDQLGGEWIGKAEDRAADYDDFTKDSFVMNAKTLITSWGSRSGHRSLKDYAWRNYEGIFQDVYTAVWQEYLDRVEANLVTGAPLNNLSVSNYFDVYWAWNMEDQSYTREAVEDPVQFKAIADRVMEECSVMGAKDENAGNLALYALLSSAAQDQDDLQILADGNVETAQMLEEAVTLDLIGQFSLSAIQVVLASPSETVEDWQVQVSVDGNTWTDVSLKIEDGLLVGSVESGIWQFVRVDASSPVEVCEIRAYGERVLPTLDQLQTLIELAEGLNFQSSSSTALKTFEAALADAREALAKSAAPDETDFCYWALYDAITGLNYSSIFNTALGKPVTAHNDPSGNSARLTDGNPTSSWDAGRLSATGLPYETTITPGYAIIDLEQVVQIREIVPVFNTNAWHHYTISISLDGENWTEVHSKMDNELPNAEKDRALLDNALARYVRLDLLNVAEGTDGKRMPVSIGEMSVNGKIYVPNFSALKQEIEKAQALQAEAYTEESWAALQEAVEQAQSLMEQTQPLPQAIEEMRTVLLQAMENLEATQPEHVDKTLLQAAVNYALSLEEQGALEGVNALVLSNFEQAKATAQAVLDSQKATQDEVWAAWSQLTRAIHMLAFYSDFTTLDMLMAQAQAILDQDPNCNARDELEQALALAEEVRNSQTALNEQSIAQAEEALRNAIALYVPSETIDTTLLAYLISVVEQTDLSAYVAEGQEEFKAALASGRDVLANPESAQQVDQAVQRLHEAWLGLRLKADESLLEQLRGFVNRAEQLDLSLYGQEGALVAEVSRQVNEHLLASEMSEQQAQEDLAAIEAVLPILEKLEKSTTQTSVDIAADSSKHAQAVSVQTAQKTGAMLFGLGLAGAALAGSFLKKRNKKSKK